MCWLIFNTHTHTHTVWYNNYFVPDCWKRRHWVSSRTCPAPSGRSPSCPSWRAVPEETRWRPSSWWGLAVELSRWWRSQPSTCPEKQPITNQLFLIPTHHDTFKENSRKKSTTYIFNILPFFGNCHFCIKHYKHVIAPWKTTNAERSG